MLLAHKLWRRTPAGTEADEGTWDAALHAVLAGLEELLHASFSALSVNEQRLATALARRPPSLRHQGTLQLVGLRKGSVGTALEGLRARADVREGDGVPRLTDPLLEHWLAERSRR